MVKTKKKPGTDQTSTELQFIEIVNWKKAQARMIPGSAPWLKLYTSLLEHDGFGGMDDSARMLIVALWLYAARSGLHILPADPKWLWRKIPMLNAEPDLGPLLEAQDVYGNPTPFIRYCKPPKARKGSKGSKGSKTDTGGKGRSLASKPKSKKKQIEENRVEESREEKREQRKPLRVSEEENRERKERISTEASAQTEAEEQTEALEPENPENPIDSEAGSAKALHIVPKPARSVTRRIGPQRIGVVVGERFEAHWQDPDCEAFGWEIVSALGYPDDRQDAKARSEWGSFAAWWSKVKAAAPVLVIDELRATAIRKADYLRTKGRSAKNKSKVWFYIMNGELHHRGVLINRQARASPAQ